MKKIICIIAAVFAALNLSAGSPRIQSQWDGVRVGVIGDSVSAPDQYNFGRNGTYWSFLEEMLGIECVVPARSGKQMNDVRRQAELLAEQNIDALFVFLGTNDFNHSVPLGEWFSTEKDTVTVRGGKIEKRLHRAHIFDDKTFKGRLNTGLALLKKTFPTKQIILFTPLHRGYAKLRKLNIQPEESYANACDLFIDDYVEAVREAGSIWAMPVVDLFSESGLYPMEQSQHLYMKANREGVTDYLHPNGLGHLRIAEVLSRKLLSIPSVFAERLPVCLSLTSFGGIPDGKTLNTRAFDAAIDSLSRIGGGKLTVPAGIWLTGPIRFCSDMELHLEKGAVVVFSSDREHYPVIDINFEGTDNRRCISQIYADHCHNISITGEGVFDGQGDDWRKVRKDKVTPQVWKKFLAKGGVVDADGRNWYPDEGYMNKEKNRKGNFDEEYIKSFLRPTLLTFTDCENVRIEGCTFQNSPSWNLHPVFCRNVVVRGITVRNPEYSSNGDGLDIDACANVLVEDSVFDCGDDAICIKSGKDADGRRHGIPAKNIIVQRCTVYHGHGGFVVGSEMSGGVENVTVRDCNFLGTDVGLRFKSRRGRGGIVKGIVIEDIMMKDIVGNAIEFDLFYFDKSDQNKAKEVSEKTPEFRDILIRDVKCSGCDRPVYINGLPEKPVSNVRILNCSFESEKEMYIERAENVEIL